MEHKRESDATAVDAGVEVALVTSRITSEMPPPPDPDLMGVYARYSTSKQNHTSIDRQVELCEAYAKQTGRRIFKVYVDEARSGASVVGRDGLEAMIKDAKAGRFSVLGIENVDRLARDLGIASSVFKTLLRSGVSIHVPGRGQLSLTDIAVQGLMGDEGRRILGERTKFSIREMAREGRFPQGACFGYDKVPGQPGVCTINPEEAKVVRRLFELRASGLPYNSICRILYAEGVRNKKGRALDGQGIKSLLRNERYAGTLVYNRHNTVKDPETGLRRIRLKPRSEWIVRSVPEVRIVDQDVWDRVRALDSWKHPQVRQVHERAKYLLSGLVKCPSCHETMYSKPHRESYWFCKHKRYFSCQQVGFYPVEALDRLVLHLVSGQLERPGYVEAYVAAYNEEQAQADAKHAKGRARLQRRVDELRNMLRNAFRLAVVEGFDAATVAEERRALEADLQEAKRDLEGTPAKPSSLRIDVQKVTALRTAVANFTTPGRMKDCDEGTLKVMALLRDFVVRVDPETVGKSAFEASVTLRIGPILDGSGCQPETLGGTRILRGACHLSKGHRRISRIPVDSSGAPIPLERFIPDEDWEAVRDLLPAVAGTRWGAPDHDPRIPVEALVQVVVTGRSWRLLPSGLGDRHYLMRRAALILRSEEWPSFAAALAARNPDRFGEILEHSGPFVEWARIWPNRLDRFKTAKGGTKPVG